MNIWLSSRPSIKMYPCKERVEFFLFQLVGSSINKQLYICTLSSYALRLLQRNTHCLENNMKCRLNVNYLEGDFFPIPVLQEKLPENMEILFPWKPWRLQWETEEEDPAGETILSCQPRSVEQSIVQTLDSALPEFQHGEAAEFLLGNQTSAVERTKLTYAAAAS